MKDTLKGILFAVLFFGFIVLIFFALWDIKKEGAEKHYREKLRDSLQIEFYKQQLKKDHL